LDDKLKVYRDAGSVIPPDGPAATYLEPVRDAKGYGRWIYCKYCYKSVNPQLSGVHQIVCSVCGSGLTPDFLVESNLKMWLKTGEFDEAKEKQFLIDHPDFLDDQKKKTIKEESYRKNKFK